MKPCTVYALFHDGPVKGRTLTLKRSPLFIRVVIDPDGEVVALDKDDPAFGSIPAVYVLQKHPCKVLIDRQDSKGRKNSINESYVDYVLHKNQPCEEISWPEQWQQWALKEFERIGGKPVGIPATTAIKGTR